MTGGSEDSHDPGPPEPARRLEDGRDSLWSYANVALRHRRLVVSLSIGSAVLVGLWSFSRPRQYVASASFIPQQALSAQQALGQLASQFGLLAERTNPESPQFYADLLTSREVLWGVLRTDYDIPGDTAFPGDLIQYFKLPADTTAETRWRALKLAQEMVTVRVEPKTGVVRLAVRTTNPVLSEQVAGRFLELLNDFNLRRRQSQAKAEREFVEQRLEQAKDSLTSAEDAVAAFYTRNRRFSDSPGLVAEEARLQRRVALRQQLYLSLSQSYEQARIAEVRNTPVVTVLERPQGAAERIARGTRSKALLGFVAGGVLAIIIAAGIEAWSIARLRDDADFKEFRTLWYSMYADLRRLVLPKRTKRD